MVYSSVSSAEQMVWISHRMEIKNRSVLALAQGHIRGGDQQDQKYFAQAD